MDYEVFNDRFTARITADWRLTWANRQASQGTGQDMCLVLFLGVADLSFRRCYEGLHVYSRAMDSQWRLIKSHKHSRYIAAEAPWIGCPNFVAIKYGRKESSIIPYMAWTILRWWRNDHMKQNLIIRQWTSNCWIRLTLLSHTKDTFAENKEDTDIVADWSGHGHVLCCQMQNETSLFNAKLN